MEPLKPLDALRLIRDSDLSGNEKRLLQALVLRADNRTRRCVLSLDKLADDASVSKRSIQRTIKDVEAKGLVKIEKRLVDGTGIRLVNAYELNLEKLKEAHPVKTAPEARASEKDVPAADSPPEKEEKPSRKPPRHSPLSADSFSRCAPQPPSPRSSPAGQQEYVSKILGSLTAEERCEWAELDAVLHEKRTREQKRRMARLFALAEERSRSSSGAEL